MKEKKYKYYEDLIEEYLFLSDEIIEIPRLIEKNKEKLDTIIAGKAGTLLKSGDANDAYKIFLQNIKYNERKEEITEELKEIQETLKEFLKFIDGAQLAYKERDDEDKTKTTYSFWIEEDTIKSNR